MQKLSSSSRYRASRFSRPPVIVVSPVSTSVTRQGSVVEWWTSISPLRMSNVTSDPCSA